MLGGADNPNGELLSYIIGADTRADSASRYAPDGHFCTDVFRADNCSDSDVSSAARHGNGSSGRRFGSACQPACALPQSPGFGSTPGVFHCTT